MATPLRPLFVIRTAMVTGVIALAVASAVVQRRVNFAMPHAEVPGLLRTMALVAAGIGTAIVIALRTRLGGAAPARAATFTILAWAAGEFAALAGLTCYLLTGVEASAAPGLLVFALAMVAFPVARA